MTGALLAIDLRGGMAGATYAIFKQANHLRVQAAAVTAIADGGIG